MKSPLQCAIGASFWLCITATGGANAGTAVVPGVHGYLSIKVDSLDERRFLHLERQRYDFSCGSAALASLLSFHYQYSTSERKVLQTMYKRGDAARIRREGFSLLDMKMYLKSLGFEAGGFRLSVDQLEEAGVPAIALTKVGGYQHFVIVKGIRGDRILIGDPALGLRVIRRGEFEEGWNGVFFLIRSHVDHGRMRFDLDSEWEMLASAPTEDAIGRASLASFTLALTN